MLPLFFLFIVSIATVHADGLSNIDAKFDLNQDGFMDGLDWRKMNDEQKKTYARMELEAMGENPGAMVSQGLTRTDLFLKGLEAVYRR